MPYMPKDPLTDPPPRPDELRRPNRVQDNSGDGMGLWLVGIIAGLLVVMLVYDYIAPISTTASAPPSRSSPTTTGAPSDRQSLGGYTAPGTCSTGPG
jgi:hypothetical protein